MIYERFLVSGFRENDIYGIGKKNAQNYQSSTRNTGSNPILIKLAGVQGTFSIYLAMPYIGLKCDMTYSNIL